MLFILYLNAIGVLSLSADKLPENLQKYQNATGISDIEIWDIYNSSLNGDVIVALEI